MDDPFYSVLLVEDEISIREGIRDIIEWENLGFQFAAEAKNGREALEIFNRIVPDLVITDIHMPKLNGLELISTIHERSKETKVVILTGFDEFDYARRALKLNVRDYLLKPVSPGELTELLERMKRELDEAAERRADEGPEARGLFRRMAMLKILSGITAPEIVGAGRENDERLVAATWFRVVVYDFDETHRSINPDMYREDFSRLAPSGVESELIPDNSGSLIEVMFSSGGPASAAVLEPSIGKKRKTISRNTGLSVSAGVGAAVSSFAEIRSSWISAETRLSRRYTRGGGSNFGASAAPETEPKDTPTKPILRFLESVESGSVEEWEERLRDIVDELKKNQSSEEQGQEIITLAISAMLNTLRKKNRRFGVKEPQSASIIKKARSYKTLDALHRWLNGLVSEFADEIKEERRDSSFAAAEKAKEYINSNYMRSSLAPEDLCSRFGVSSSTLSRIFKRCMDTNFSSYLRDVRIHAAKKLIRQTDMRNKEIASHVGFNSPHYFSHVFTKRVGYSPSEYRRNMNKGSRPISKIPDF